MNLDTTTDHTALPQPMPPVRELTKTWDASIRNLNEYTRTTDSETNSQKRFLIVKAIQKGANTYAKISKHTGASETAISSHIKELLKGGHVNLFKTAKNRTKFWAVGKDFDL